LHNVNPSFSNSKPDYSWWTDNNQSEVRKYHLLHLAGIRKHTPRSTVTTTKPYVPSNEASWGRLDTYRQGLI
jgi:hypothetical protein